MVDGSDDSRLIKEVSLGKPEAVTELYNSYVNKVYSIVYNQVDRDHNTTQEIVQNIFLAAIKSAKNFGNRSKVRTWLYSITRNKIADYYRHKKRGNKLQVVSSLDIDTIEDKGLLSAKSAEVTENQELIKQAMDTLSVHYKDILILKYIEDMSVDEIGETLNRTPKSVEGILSRARKELKTALIKKGLRDNNDLQRLLI